jgi:hypothetical protein
LAYEAIFGVPVRDLFAGIYGDIAVAVGRRAEQMLASVSETRLRAGRVARRHEVLQGIVHRAA